MVHICLLACICIYAFTLEFDAHNKSGIRMFYVRETIDFITAGANIAKKLTTSLKSIYLLKVK